MSPATSESFNGVDPGIKGRANAKLPMGTMTVDAMNKTLAEPNLYEQGAIVSVSSLDKM